LQNVGECCDHTAICVSEILSRITWTRPPIYDTVVPQVFARTLAEYAVKIGQRALSDLTQISDQELLAGMRALECDAQLGGEHPIVEPIALFVFQKV
jgi:hypothetical protein